MRYISYARNEKSRQIHVVSDNSRFDPRGKIQGLVYSYKELNVRLDSEMCSKIHIQRNRCDLLDIK